MKWIEGTVVENIHWTENLFSLKIDADVGGNQILADDWRRIAILIQNLGSNQVTIRPKIAAQVGVGLDLISGAVPLLLKFADVGSLTTLSWFAIADIMNSNIIIYETLYTPLIQK